jgi:hypothetical protein
MTWADWLQVWTFTLGAAFGATLAYLRCSWYLRAKARERHHG